MDSTKPAKPDQSRVFFPPTIDTYGLDLTPVDRDHLAELHALRQIDPCGFVAPDVLINNDHKDFSYTYQAGHWIESGDRAPIEPLSADGCTVVLPSATIGLAIQVLAGEPRWDDAQFSPDPLHPGVIKRSSPTCAFRAALPLTGLVGAPKSMRDPVVEVGPIDITDNKTSIDDTSLCQLGEAVADAIAADAREKGIPTYFDHASTAATFLASDPCAATLDLHATGLLWKEPNPNAQLPTTWRHPSVCNLVLGDTNDDPAAHSAVIKYGLLVWSESILDTPWGEVPVHSERDGVELFDFSSYLAPGCLVVAKTNISIDPTDIGAGAPGLAPSTPVVTVQLTAPDGGNCADVASHAAVAAVKRAT